MLLAESDFAADRAASALIEVVTCLCILARRQSRRHDGKLSVRSVVDALKRAGLDDMIQYAMAHEEYGRMVRRRNRLSLMD